MKKTILFVLFLSFVSIGVGFYLGGQGHYPESVPDGNLDSTKLPKVAEFEVNESPLQSRKGSPSKIEDKSDTEDEYEVEEESVEAFDYQAIESLGVSMEEGDERAPPLSPRTERELPTKEELEDHDEYQRYEGRQTIKTYRAYVLAAQEKEKFLKEMIALAKQDGLPPEQIEEGEEKLRRIEKMRLELMEQYPDLLLEENQ